MSVDTDKDNITVENAHKHTVQETQIVGIPRMHVRRKLLVLSLSSLILVALVGFITWKFVTHYRDANTKSANSSVSQTKQTKISPETQVNDLTYKGDYAAAQKILAAEQTQSQTPDSKLYLYVQQASVSLNAKDYVTAMAYAQAAEKFKPSSASAGLIAAVAAASGDTSTAKTNYELAITRLDKTDRSYGPILHQYQASIAELNK